MWRTAGSGNAVGSRFCCEKLTFVYSLSQVETNSTCGSPETARLSKTPSRFFLQVSHGSTWFHINVFLRFTVPAPRPTLRTCPGDVRDQGVAGRRGRRPFRRSCGSAPSHQSQLQRWCVYLSIYIYTLHMITHVIIYIYMYVLIHIYIYGQ